MTQLSEKEQLLEKKAVELSTVIKGTKTIDEYEKKLLFMNQKATEFYSRHKEAVEDWKEGEPVKVWFDMDDNLCIEYESGKCWHYNEKGEW